MYIASRSIGYPVEASKLTKEQQAQVIAQTIAAKTIARMNQDQVKQAHKKLDELKRRRM
jgi:hypothetical protein